MIVEYGVSKLGLAGTQSDLMLVTMSFGVWAYKIEMLSPKGE